MHKPAPSSRVLRIGNFELDPSTGELAREGRKTQLTVQTLQVLLALVETPGQLVTREELVRRLWPEGTFVDFDHSLNKAVNKLRDALGDSADKPSYIETFPRRGYRLIAAVEKPPDPPVADVAGSIDTNETAAVADLPAEKLEVPATPGKPRIFYFGATAAVLCALALLVALVPSWRNALLGRPSSRTLTDRDTILLTDFENKTGDPVFDEALKQGLLAELSQSPFLSILPEGAVRRQLRYMGRPADTALTQDVALEVCRRADSKAVLTGSVSSLGTIYAITLQAVNCEDGGTLHVEQKQADRREQVLAKLHEAARALRGRLGESLASIQKHDVPPFEATTSSLEALQAVGVAMKTWRSQGNSAALPLFQRAVEIDPNFALANTGLGILYANLGRASESAEYLTRAYKLRDRVTELERFSIDSAYYLNVTGELEKAIQVNEQWRQIYSRNASPLVNLAVSYSKLGRYDKALAADLEALPLASNTSQLYANIFSDYVNLERLPDARALLQQAQARKIDDPLLIDHYQLAFLDNNAKEMERLVTASQGTDSENTILASQADTEAFHGNLSKAREFSRRAVDTALKAGDREGAAGWLTMEAIREAELGDPKIAEQRASSALSLITTKDVQVGAAMVFARTGNAQRSQSLLKVLETSYPSNTMLSSYWVPTIRAAIALRQGQPASTLEQLKAVAAYELGGGKPPVPFVPGATMYPAYLRGQAFLALQRWEEAAAEFNKILAHRGLLWNFPVAALAQLDLAYAYKGAGNSGNTQSAAEAFFALWKDADNTTPILVKARNDFSRHN